MNYLKLDRYVVVLEGIHGILHTLVPGNPHDPALRGKILGNINITYLHKKDSNPEFTTSFLEFPSKEDSQKAFDKIAEALGAS